MKRKYVLVIIAAILLSAIKVFGQEKPADLVSKAELVKKYEADKAQLQKMLMARIDELAKNDIQIQSINAAIGTYTKLIEELKENKTIKKEETK